jgi:hypothetical protein
MVTLEIRENELPHLRSCLEAALKVLQHEIARTEHREFREMLLEKDRALTAVLERIPSTVPA